MRLNLFLSFLLVCGITYSQTNTKLKDFINKNYVAIKTVQKNMVREDNTSFVTSFKVILKNQEAAVRLANSDKNTSIHFAYLVRTECIAFLKSHSRGSTQYFEMTFVEKAFTKSLTENSNILTSSDIKTIDDLDVMNSQSLNNITLTIK